MFWGIGSNITSIPTIKALKEKYPNSKITLLAPEKNKDLFYDNKDVNNLIFADLGLISLLSLLLKNVNKFDLVIDMEHWMNISAIISFVVGKRTVGFSNRFRSILYSDKIPFNRSYHSVENNLNLVRLITNVKKQYSLVKIKTKESDKKFIDEYLKKNKINNKDKIIGICPGSGPTVTERRWPKERFAELADIIIDKYKLKVIIVGSNDEKELVNSVKKLMKNNAISATDINLSQLIELTNRCNLFISNDTGPMHIAAAQGIKTIGIFGPETPEIFAPFGKNNISFFKKLKCSPCIKIFEGRHIKCNNNHKCMKLISVKEVFGAVKQLLR